jgi:hypothetical protein
VEGFFEPYIEKIGFNARKTGAIPLPGKDGGLAEFQLRKDPTQKPSWIRPLWGQI